MKNLLIGKTKISDKYQVVIPKIMRRRISFKRGDYLIVTLFDNGLLIKKEKVWPDDYINELSNIWKNINSRKYLKRERKSWD